MSGSLIGGLVGAAIGFAVAGPVGAQVGWTLGSLAGSLIDPPKQEGPKLSDLKTQHSTYGAPIPIFYGTIRAAGNVIWQTDLIEHEQKSGGKGGGPEVTEYTYSASFAIALGEGPILGIRKIWADRRLISETGLASEGLPFVLYLGTEAQLPDPTMEAAEGVGEVPAHRGTAYIVFTDLYLADYGNRIPVFEFEIEASGDAAISRVSTWNIPDTPAYTGRPAAPVAGVKLIAGELHVYQYTEAAVIYNGLPTSSYLDEIYDLQGNVITNDEEPHVPNPNDAVSSTWVPSLNSNAAQGIERGAGTTDVSFFYVAGARGLGNHPPSGFGTNDYYAMASPPVFGNDSFYATGGSASTSAYLGKWGPTGGTASAGYDLYTGNSWPSAGTNYSVCVADDGTVWVLGPGGSSALRQLWKFTAALTLVHHWDPAELPSGIEFIGLGTGTFTIYRGRLLIPAPSTGPDTNAFAYLYTINDDFTFTFADKLAVAGATNTYSFVALGGGYVATNDGILRLGGTETLAAIVADVCERCGLDDTRYDVSDLTETVAGYTIASNMTGRNAIEPLRQAYFFDGVEVDDLLLFTHRDGVSVATIADDDLGAHAGDGEPPPLLGTSRTPDHELPRRVSIVHIDPETDYQIGTQYGTRLTGGSAVEVALQLPIVLYNDEARQIADKHVFLADIEREQFAWYTTRKWEGLVPTDVVTIQGRVLRITDKRSAPDGVIEFRGVTSRAIAFEQSSVGAPGGGTYLPTVPSAIVQTQLVLLDIPLLTLQDAPYGFYAAMGPAGRGKWTGATLYKSADSGSSWTALVSTATPSVIGEASGALANYTGGVVLDTVSGPITIVLTNPNAELVSITSGALDAGGNLCAIKSGSGWELLQFQNATLTAPNTYQIAQPYYRGVKSTEAFNAGHAAGDTFVLLPVTNVDAPATDLNVAFDYKAVSFGLTLASATAQTFTNTGEGAGSYGPPTTDLLDVFVGDTGSPSNPSKGLVPAPAVGDAALDFFLSADGTWKATPGGTPTITVQEEGVTTSSVVTTINFTGASVTASGAGATATVNVASSGVSDGDKGDISVSSSGTVWTVDADAVTNTKLANMATATFKGRTIAGTGDPQDLTVAEATALLNNLVGDSGSGGTKGLVPAPAAGDGAASKVLLATGAWGSIGAAGGGVPTGGATDDVLTKNSSTDYDTEWTTHESFFRRPVTRRLARWWQIANYASASQDGVGIAFSGSAIVAGAAFAATYRGQFKASLLRSTTVQNNVAYGESQIMGLRGDAANIGGFYYRGTIAVDVIAATAKWFVGLRKPIASGAAGFVPSNGVDCAYFGIDNGDTNIQFMHNDAAGICTKIDLGGSFDAQTADRVYTLEIYCPGNDGNITYKITRHDNEAQATGTISTNQPTNTAGLCIAMYVQGNTAAVASSATDIAQIHHEFEMLGMVY